jgi:hypothetical protein
MIAIDLDHLELVRLVPSSFRNLSTCCEVGPGSNLGSSSQEGSAHCRAVRKKDVGLAHLHVLNCMKKYEK